MGFEKIQSAEQITDLSRMTYEELDTAGWNAYLKCDAGMLAKIAYEAGTRKRLESAAAKNTTDILRYSALSETLNRSLDNLRGFLKGDRNG